MAGRVSSKPRLVWLSRRGFVTFLKSLHSLINFMKKISLKNHFSHRIFSMIMCEQAHWLVVKPGTPLRWGFTIFVLSLELSGSVGR
jgi:hypothetical protein